MLSNNTLFLISYYDSSFLSVVEFNARRNSFFRIENDDSDQHASRLYGYLVVQLFS